VFSLENRTKSSTLSASSRPSTPTSPIFSTAPASLIEKMNSIEAQSIQASDSVTSVAARADDGESMKIYTHDVNDDDDGDDELDSEEERELEKMRKEEERWRQLVDKRRVTSHSAPQSNSQSRR
jgi:hypothetical protein